MRIVPAVDIRGGLCVNLVQGDYGQETVFSDNPVAQAIYWRDEGAELVHIVDLDGARAGALMVEAELNELMAHKVPFEVGGGIRTRETIEAVIETGAERVILGTAAHKDPDLLREAARAHPGRIAVGIDARAGKVSLEAWVEDTETDAVEFAKRVADAGAARIIYTDILSDGKLRGPNLETTRAVADAVDIPVTASGGMATLENIRALRALEPCGVEEVIIGRALYVGAFSLPEAIAVAREIPAR